FLDKLNAATNAFVSLVPPSIRDQACSRDPLCSLTSAVTGKSGNQLWQESQSTTTVASTRAAQAQTVTLDLPTPPPLAREANGTLANPTAKIATSLEPLQTYICGGLMGTVPVPGVGVGEPARAGGSRARIVVGGIGELCEFDVDSTRP